jgi:hypothetical protein
VSPPIVLLLVLAGAQPRIAVLDLKARVAVSADLAQAVTDDVVAEVRRLLPNAKVISADEIRSTLKYDLQKRDLGCNVASCLSEIGGALGVELLVTGTLSKFGKTYLLSLKTIDPRAATVTHEYTQQIGGESDEALLAAVAPGVRQLFPELASPPQAVIPAPLILVPPEASPEPQPKAPIQTPPRDQADLFAGPAARTRATKAPPDAVSLQQPRTGSSNEWRPVVGWTGVGLSIAALAAGGILLGVAANERSAANSDPTAAGAYNKNQTANTENAAAIGALIGAGVLLIPSLVLLLLPHDPAPSLN